MKNLKDVLSTVAKTVSGKGKNISKIGWKFMKSVDQDGWKTVNVDDKRNLFTVENNNIIVTFSEYGYNAADKNKNYETIDDGNGKPIKNLNDVIKVLKSLDKHIKVNLDKYLK